MDTARAAGAKIAAPSDAFLASREQLGDPERLWQWVFEQGAAE